MKQRMKRWCIALALLTCILISTTLSINAALATAPHPVRHSTPVVVLSIKFGRIFFTPNTVTCTHTAKPCFTLKYVSNDGPRPVWLDHTQEYILQTGQTWPFTFPNASTHTFTLFQYSPWWKILVHVL